MKRGKFITLEGIEGCGKTTQIKRLVRWLKQRGVPVLQLREPGGTPAGEVIRKLLKHHPAGRGMCAETELLLFTASRAELVRKVIEPALRKGTWVVCDRFHDSTNIYQGAARGLKMKTVREINQFAIGKTMPDMTLVLDMPPPSALKRVQKRKNSLPDRFDNETLNFHRKVRAGFRRLALQEPKRVRRINADKDANEVFKAIQKEVEDAFSGLLD